MREAGWILAAFGRRRARIAADARPGKLQRRLHVRLRHHVVNRHHAAVALRHQIERRIGRLLVPLLGDCRE